ncbi:hypothetical protein TWF569_008646 [Orbilia oligospora]|nr:hypothetical protein TWF569_008646 [Orbilia oligospora]
MAVSVASQNIQSSADVLPPFIGNRTLPNAYAKRIQQRQTAGIELPSPSNDRDIKQLRREIGAPDALMSQIVKYIREIRAGSNSASPAPTPAATGENDGIDVSSDLSQLDQPPEHHIPSPRAATADLETFVPTIWPSLHMTGLTDSTLKLYQFFAKRFYLPKSLQICTTSDINQVSAAILEAKSKFDERGYYQMRRRKSPRRPRNQQKGDRKPCLLQRELKALKLDKRDGPKIAKSRLRLSK